jgi:hypothetical protein
LLRSLDPTERLARLDLALRAAAPDLVAQGAVVLAALLGDSGDVRLYVRGAAVPNDDRWHLDLLASTWTLPAAVGLEALAAAARECAAPCPAIVHLGSVPQGELFVDLEAVGVLSVDSPHAEPILRAVAASLAASPFIEAGRVFTVGLCEVELGDAASESLDTLDAALDAAALALGSTTAVAASEGTFALRTHGTGGEAWEPAVVVASGVAGERSSIGALAAVIGGRGLGVALDAPGGGAAWVLRFDGSAHVLSPLGLRLQPQGLGDADVKAVAELVAAAGSPLVVDDVSRPQLPPQSVVDHRAPFVEQPWSLVVRVLGPIEVVDRTGRAVEFERSKSMELVAWLVQHRRRPTRAAARTALWDLDVRDATFANVVSDARRAMARVVTPASGAEWIARTLTDELPLHSEVVSDAELLAARVHHAQGLGDAAAIAVLRPGLEWVVALPFSGTSYLWTDAEGLASSLVLLVTGAACRLAEHYLAIGDVDGVFWATGQGLQVLSGHEELIALRMRAHARHGDRAGVRHEWESYERALAADPWAAAEPAPKLVALRRELLGSAVGARA